MFCAPEGSPSVLQLVPPALDNFVTFGTMLSHLGHTKTENTKFQKSFVCLTLAATQFWKSVFLLEIIKCLLIGPDMRRISKIEHPKSDIQHIHLWVLGLGCKNRTKQI